jgi:hypothetical protein
VGSGVGANLSLNPRGFPRLTFFCSCLWVKKLIQVEINCGLVSDAFCYHYSIFSESSSAASRSLSRICGIAEIARIQSGSNSSEGSVM